MNRNLSPATVEAIAAGEDDALEGGERAVGRLAVQTTEDPTRVAREHVDDLLDEECTETDVLGLVMLVGQANLANTSTTR